MSRIGFWGSLNATYSAFLNGSHTVSPKVSGFGVDFWDPILTSIVPWYQDWSGQALMVNVALYGISPEETVRRALKEGYALGYQPPVAIVIPGFIDIAGFVSIARDYSDVSYIKIPTVEIDIDCTIVIEVLANLSTPIYLEVIIVDDDPNLILLAWNAGKTIISGIILGCVCLVCVITNIYKFQLHLRFTHGVTTPKIFFVIDLLGNFMRFWFLCIDPFYQAHISYLWGTVCTTTHFALSIVCTLLIGTKWREMLDRSKVQAAMFLSTYRYPFIAAAVIIFAVEFISASLRGHWFNVKTLAIASWSFLVVIGYIVSGLVFFTGGQILHRLAAAVGNSKRIWQLNQTTWLLLISGLFLFIWSVAQMAWIIKVYKYGTVTIGQTNVFICLQFLWLFIVSFLQNWAMPIPSRPTPSHASISSSHNTISKRGITSRADDDTRKPALSQIDDDTSSDEKEKKSSKESKPKKNPVQFKSSFREKQEESSDDDSDGSDQV